MTFPAEVAANGNGGEGQSEEGEGGDESAAAVAAVLNGAVAAVVYRSAVKAVLGSVGFRAKFLDILHPFDFPGRPALEVRCATVAVRAGGPPGGRRKRHLGSCGCKAGLPAG